MDKAHHPIQLVARLTGLSTFVIRIWEQRYRAVEPQRTRPDRRLYREHLEKIGAIATENLTHLSLTLDTLRKPAREAKQ